MKFRGTFDLYEEDIGRGHLPSVRLDVEQFKGFVWRNASVLGLAIAIATMVISLPSRLVSALPRGTRYSSSGTIPFRPYSLFVSMNITGLSSLMLDLSSPLASYGVEGITTFSPGM